jgi:hypothetical protein
VIRLTRESRVSLVGVAHAPSPDVHYGHPALRSLDAGCALGILPSLAANAGSWGMANPSLTLVQQERFVREHHVKAV